MSLSKEHYYDVEGGTGYLAWRIKTIQRCTAKERRLTSGAPGDGSSSEDQCGGPTVRRELQFVTEKVLSEDECKDTISLMKHSLTFVYRHNMVLDPLLSSNILSVFPRFKDIKGLIEQDFILMFGEDVSFRLLERWPTTFKRKIIQQGRKLPSTSDLELLLAADSPEDATEVNADIGWDSNSIAITSDSTIWSGSLETKVSASQAERHLVVFKKVCVSFLFLCSSLCLTRMPCKSTSSLGAFDELFKAHFVFGTSYSTMLHNMYMFIQITVHNIDVGKVKESPRVAEVRTRLLLWGLKVNSPSLSIFFVSSMEEVFFEIHTQAKDSALQSVPSQDTTSKNKYNSNKIKH
ncbi:hypothetical protein ACER0C_014842 [Sarotherodon galilaeus]